jgi:type I restriction enzyme S subunit
MVNASDVMDVHSGGTPKTSTPSFWDGGIPFFTPKDATDTPFVMETEKTVTEAGLRSCNSQLYPPGTLFITARGTVGKLNLALAPMAMNQSCYALRSKSHVGQHYMYLVLRESIQRIQSTATGAVFDAIIVATFDRVPFLLPLQHITEAFALHVGPMFDQIANLIRQNQKLARARDLLLPRLMNGEMAV